MAKIAGQMTLQYEPECSREFAAFAATLFGDSAMIRDRFYGLRAGVHVDIVDVARTSAARSGEGETNHSESRRTVCLMSAGDLPEFTLMPRTRQHRLLSMLNLGGMSFDADALESTRDRNIVRGFNNDWQVAVSDLLAAIVTVRTITTESETRVRNLFTTQLMEALHQLRGYSTQVRAGKLLVWRGDSWSDAKDRAPLADAAITLRSRLLASLEAPQGATAPAIPGKQPERHAQRAMGAVVGGAIGAIACFIGGFLIFVTFVFHRDDLPGIVTPILFFALPLGGAVMGGLAGAFAGSRIGNHFNLPFMLHAAQGQPPSVWASFAPFLGFALGGAIGFGSVALLLEIFGENSLPALLTFGIFFACPIAGLVGGAIVRHRLRTRKR